MKIAILIHESKFDILKQKYNTDIPIYSYKKIDELNSLKFKTYDYIIVLNLLWYINFNALKKFLEKHSPIFAGLPTYWGIGTDDIAIIHKSLLNNFQSKKNSTLPDHNLICELFLRAVKISSISKIFNKSKKTLDYLFHKNKIVNLSKNTYSVNKINAKGHYHNSIFINHTDDPEYFLNWYKEYDTKQKKVYINNITYNTFIGINFFIIQKKHVVLLGTDNFYFWGSNNSWKKIRSKQKIFNIIQYIKDNASKSYKILGITPFDEPLLNTMIGSGDHS